MTSNWEKFKKNLPASKADDLVPQGMPIYGAFVCQHCSLEAEEATYYATDSVLKWRCPEGHTSFAENFRLS